MSVKTPTGWDANYLTNYSTPVPGHLVTGRGRVIPNPNGERTYAVA
jgi:hypothetical protein